MPRNVSIKRISLTCSQSMARFGNPYGDDANMVILALNTAWKARQYVTMRVGPESLPFIDADMKELVNYLAQHEQARPWEFDPINGYHYKDLSYCNWEGRWTTR
jgi:hypothetical protein